MAAVKRAPAGRRQGTRTAVPRIQADALVEVTAKGKSLPRQHLGPHERKRQSRKAEAAQLWVRLPPRHSQNSATATATTAQ
jgi:hypothetical protein